MSKKSTELGVGKKVLASALSAAMVVAFAPAVAMATEEESTEENGNFSNSESNVAVVDKNQSGQIDEGDEGYSTLQEAINAAENEDGASTIILTQDVALDTLTSVDKEKSMVFEKANTDITLDLNNKVVNPPLQ